MKKIFSVLFVMIMLISLVGCGDENKDDGLILTGIINTVSSSNWFVVETKNGNFGITSDNTTEIKWENQEDYETVWGNIGPTGVSSLDCDLAIEVVCGEETEAPDVSLFEEIATWYKAGKIIVTGLGEWQEILYAKPVIYLYPEEKMNVAVKLDYDGELTCTYPKSNGTWNVTAQPDGTLFDENGQEYNYLYWEGVTDVKYDFSKGFCVKGEDTAEFLETVLADLGLTRREANEFIVYWLPLMEVNEYNVISFQTDVYEENAKLTVEPTPDTVIRVFMAWYGTDDIVDIEPQKFVTSERTGFTVVEWGGGEVKR